MQKELDENKAPTHIHQTKAVHQYSKLIHSIKVYSSNASVLFLSFCADGYLTFRKGQRCTEFMAVRVVSYTREFGYKLQNIILVGLVNGPTHPKTMQPYMKLFIADLEILAKGVISRDPTNPSECRLLYAYLALVIADYPGHGEIHCLEHHASKNGCYKCTVQWYGAVGQRQWGMCRTQDLLSADEEVEITKAWEQLQISKPEIGLTTLRHCKQHARNGGKFPKPTKKTAEWFANTYKVMADTGKVV